jgi:pyrroline-5-carboxylate reductase
MVIKSNIKLNFIGGGKMAEAIINGVLTKKLVSTKNILISEPLKIRRDYLKEKFGIKTTSENLKTIKSADFLILCIKPQDLSIVSKELKNKIDSKIILLSILAGMKIESLTSQLGHKKIIRAMPNIPAQIGKGMIAWTHSNDINDNELKLTKTILKTLGKEIHFNNQKQIDIATSISGSGPAYIFYIVEALINAGVYLGLTKEISKKLVLQTIEGSTSLIKKDNTPLPILTDMVTSPGGTTAEALMLFEHEGLKSIIAKAVIAAYEKSKELSQSS